MRLRNLSTFLAVARLGSFHAAAVQLHASQPAISARIGALEAELGVKLFTRDKSGTRITARGTQLIPFAEKLLSVQREMFNQLQDSTSGRGTLRVGVADTIAHLWLSELLQSWQQQHPLLSFELRTETTEVIRHQLSHSELDLALMVADGEAVPHPDLVSEPLCAYPQRWIASPRLIEDSTQVTLETLAEYPLLSFPRQTRPWRYLQRVLSTHEAPSTTIHTCGSVAGLLKLVTEGVGIALLPAPLVQDALNDGELIILDALPQPPKLHFCCSWRLDDERILPRLLADTARSLVTPPQITDSNTTATQLDLDKTG